MSGITLALRALIRSPGYAVVAIATLALGIGAATSMFSLIHASLLRPLPYEEVDRLIRFRDHHTPTGGGGSITTANFLDIQREARTLADVAVYTSVAFNVTAGDQPQRASGLRVTSNFFRTLGTGPVIGRGFTEGEDRAGRPDIAVISHRTWQDQFGGGPDVLGATILLDAVPHEVVGVLPEAFWFPGEPTVIAPFAWSQEAMENRGNRWAEGLARLAPGVDIAGAHAELSALMTRLGEEFPESNANWTITTEPFAEWALGRNRTSLLLLNGAVLLLLLIGVANVANLILVRAERRTRETAVRVALGASRTRLAAQFVGEGLLLGVLGAVLGMLVASGATRAMLALFGGGLPRAADAALTPPVLGFAMLLAVIAGALVGLVPVLRMSTDDVHDTLRDAGRGGARRASRLQQALVIAEVAVAVLLVCGAGLMINTFLRLNTVEPGVRIDDTLVFSVQLPGAAYDSREATALFYERALEAIHNIPGVASAGISERPPLQGGYNVTTVPSPADPEVTASFVEIRTVNPEFFAAAGIPLRAGRGITEEDVSGQRPVAVISDELARTLFGEDDPLGRTLLAEWNGGFEIVGVVGSVREFGLTGARRPAIYWPFQLIGRRNAMVVVVHAPGDPMAVMPAIRREIAALDPTLPIFDVKRMSDVVTETLGARWLAAQLFTAFGVLALLLAALGIFAVLAYVVEQRTREIGIRMALGATAGRVQTMVVGQGLRLVAIGLVIGLAAAAYASRLLTDLLWEVEPADPVTFAVVAAVALTTAAAAAFLPALRATRVEPAVALGEE